MDKLPLTIKVPEIIIQNTISYVRKKICKSAFLEITTPEMMVIGQFYFVRIGVCDSSYRKVYVIFIGNYCPFFTILI